MYAGAICIRQSTIFCYQRPNTQESESFMHMFFKHLGCWQSSQAVAWECWNTADMGIAQAFGFVNVKCGCWVLEGFVFTSCFLWAGWYQFLTALTQSMNSCVSLKYFVPFDWCCDLCNFQESLKMVMLYFGFLTQLPCKLYVILFRYGVAVQDFASSWRSGLAFLAIIKAIDSTLVDMKHALEKSARENLEDAFSIAQNKLGVPRLLEPEGKTFTSALLGNIQTTMSTLILHWHTCRKPPRDWIIDVIGVWYSLIWKKIWSLAGSQVVPVTLVQIPYHNFSYVHWSRLVIRCYMTSILLVGINHCPAEWRDVSMQ